LGEKTIVTHELYKERRVAIFSGVKLNNHNGIVRIGIQRVTQDKLCGIRILAPGCSKEHDIAFEKVRIDRGLIDGRCHFDLTGAKNLDDPYTWAINFIGTLVFCIKDGEIAAKFTIFRTEFWLKSPEFEEFLART
jgi:hypothetical protein